MKRKYLQIKDPDLRDKIKSIYNKEVGTYILRWFKNGKPRNICRLLDTDCHGVLYIGETEKTLFSRVASLATAILSNSKKDQSEPVEIGHHTFSKKFFRIRKHIDVNDLYVEVISCKISPKKDESKLIEEYVAEYGELPPLNGNYGQHAHWDLF